MTSQGTRQSRNGRRPARRSGARTPETAGFAARKAAAEILHEVLKSNQPLDDAFAASIASGTLGPADPRDRALARLIVATTLRRLPEVEAAIGSFMSKPLGDKTGLAHETLLTGAAQMMFLDIAAHAVVNVATSIAGSDRHARHFKGLVNAVLRNLSKSTPTPLQGREAVEANLPGWLLESWGDAYGQEAALAIGGELFEDPPLDLTVKSSPEDWAERLGGFVLPNGSIRIAKPGRVESLDGFEAGEWWVQDAAASVPAKLLTAAEGMSVIDLCAAPGGKTAQLAQTGASVTAVDRDAKRIDRLRGNLARLGLKAETVVADGTKWRPDEPADAVLLDAPCSATGIFRRHPDILRRRNQDRIAPLAGLQAGLIDAAFAMLKPGGTLIYCTCSLEPAEGEAQVAAALTRQSGLSVSTIETEDVPGFEASVTAQGALRILPHVLEAPAGCSGGSDGFFVSRLTKG